MSLHVEEKDIKEYISNYWLNLGDTSKILTTNLFTVHEDFQESPALALVDILRKPENFGFTCKFLFNIQLHPFQAAVLYNLWHHSFPMLIGSRGSSKSFLLAIYAILVCIFRPGSKVVITGSAFRQAKIIFSYVENIWRDSFILKDILHAHDRNNRPTHDTDMYSFKIFSSSIVAIPLGNGERIRGLRSSCLLADEFNSIDINIFEEVLRGFTSVSLSPIQNVMDYAKLEALKSLGKISQEQIDLEQDQIASNQIIISGTPGYTFENLFKYWKRYRDIIMTGGDKKKLEQLLDSETPEGFSHRDYCIMRFPYTLLPKGFMDHKAIGQASATSGTSVFISEYNSVFLKDSNGFFKRSLIENCVCGRASEPIRKESCGVVEFNASLRGDKQERHVMAVDPAAAQDNLAIVILGIRPEHRRIKYVWTINAKRHKQRVKHDLVKENDYYRYCGRKIRELKKLFSCDAIGIDAQGGGQAIREVLGDPANLDPGEYPFYPIKEDDIDKDTDNLEGLHILHMIEFSNAAWVYEANHALRQDMETRELIFPLKDSLAYGLAREEDKMHNRIIINEDQPEMENLSDTLEDCLLEIEELKNELTIIEHSKTPTGRDKWDTPQIKTAGMKKGRLRKDRYSALLMANAIGRKEIARLVKEEYPEFGGTARSLAKAKKQDYAFGIGVRRGYGRF